MDQFSLEEQLQALSDCGVRLRPDVTLEDLFVHAERADFEASHFAFLLDIMGSECGPGLAKRASDDVWAFDGECIEGDGSYVEIAERVAALAHEALPIENVRDSVNHDAGQAWLAFRLAGREQRWGFPVDGDDVDVEVFTKFDKLLAASDLRLIMCRELILVGTPGKLARLKELTGLPLRWMMEPLTS